MFVAINLLASALSETLAADSPHRATAERVAHLAERGKAEIGEVARALAFLPATKRGLAPALRALAADMASDSGIDVRVEIVGAERRLAPKTERGLYKVAHEAIANAWRHAECDVITVRLAFRDDEVRLEIVDDGKTGDRCRVEEGTGIAGMRRVARELGGSIRVGPRRSHGFSVVLQLPGGTS
jgi:signal transduction histidine kinase